MRPSSAVTQPAAAPAAVHMMASDPALSRRKRREGIGLREAEPAGRELWLLEKNLSPQERGKTASLGLPLARHHPQRIARQDLLHLVAGVHRPRP
jgi:hypothetical protein